MKKIITMVTLTIITVVSLLTTTTLSSCSKKHDAFDIGSAQILISSKVGYETCKNVKCIYIEDNGTAYYTAVTTEYEIKTFIVSYDGIVKEE